MEHFSEVLFFIAPKGKSAVDISELADEVLFQGRPPKEVVFLPDTKFKVTKNFQEGDYHYIELEEQ